MFEEICEQSEILCTLEQVRLGTYASDVYMPPSAIVASKAMASDPRAEPKYCERVPYVVVAGPIGARLMDLVRVTLSSSPVLYCV